MKSKRYQNLAVLSIDVTTNGGGGLARPWCYLDARLVALYFIGYKKYFEVGETQTQKLEIKKSIEKIMKLSLFAVLATGTRADDSLNRRQIYQRLYISHFEILN